MSSVALPVVGKVAEGNERVVALVRVEHIQHLVHLIERVRLERVRRCDFRSTYDLTAVAARFA